MVMLHDQRLGAFSFLVVSVATLLLLFPIYWMLVSSLTPRQEVMTARPQLAPPHLTLEHYQRVLTQSSFPTHLGNSAKVAVLVTLLSIPMSFTGGYVLSRYRFPGRQVFGHTLLVTQMLPAMMLAIPLYVTLSVLGLINTHAALVVCYTTFAIPFSTWLLKGFFDGVPRELEEAAQIDGCSRAGMMWRLVLPLSAPGLVAAAMVTFLLAWNEYLFALVFINSDQLKTFPVGITLFISRWQIDYGALMAASVMVAVPVSVLFLGLQRWFVRGLTGGAIKD